MTALWCERTLLRRGPGSERVGKIILSTHPARDVGLLPVLHERNQRPLAVTAIQEGFGAVHPPQQGLAISRLLGRERRRLAIEEQASVGLAVHQFGIERRAPTEQWRQRQHQ